MLFEIRRAKRHHLFSQYGICQQGFPCYGSFELLLESQGSNVTTVGAMDAKKIAEEKTFCDLLTCLHLFYRIFHAIKIKKIVIFFQYTVSFYAYFELPFLANICDNQSE